VTLAAPRWIGGCIDPRVNGGSMLKLMLAAAVALGAFGCSHTCQQAKADYHQSRADSATENGNRDKAAHEQQKADTDQAKANYAPLP
jgi:hypothetical protein